MNADARDAAEPQPTRVNHKGHKEPSAAVGPQPSTSSGWKTPAQGNALGIGPPHEASPERAQEEAARMRASCAPSGLRPFAAGFPRALPWAGFLQPFRLKICVPRKESGG